MCTSAAAAAMEALICSVIELKEEYEEIQSSNIVQRCHGILPRAIGGSVGKVSSWLFSLRFLRLFVLSQLSL